MIVKNTAITIITLLNHPGMELIIILMLM